jgi:sulfonate transport system substrate-binding protein
MIPMSDNVSDSRKKLERVWWGVVGALVVALLLGGLSFALFATRGGAETPTKVRIATVVFQAGGKPVLAGTAALVESDGWLRNELSARGIELEWVPAPHASVAATINEGFANGRLDFASYGDLPSLIANAAGVRTKLVVPSGRGTDTHLIVPADSTARSIEDLKGKRIALHRGRPWELPFQRLLDSKGLKYEDFTILNLNPEAGATAILGKKVDAMYAMTDAYVLEERGAAKIIWSTADAPADWKLRAELWGSEAFIDAHPELTELVARAFVRAAHFASLEENRARMLKLGTASGTPESVVRRSLEAVKPYRDNWSPLFDANVVEHYRHSARLAFDKGLVSRLVDFEEIHDPRFVASSLRALGLEGYWVPAGATAAADTGSP